MKLTSGGIDKGAFPMCDSLAQLVENVRAGTLWNAGSRKLGIEIEVEDAIALSKPRALVVDNIANFGRCVVAAHNFSSSKAKARDERGLAHSLARISKY
jgi:hypothetical protein